MAVESGQKNLKKFGIKKQISEGQFWHQSHKKKFEFMVNYLTYCYYIKH